MLSTIQTLNIIFQERGAWNKVFIISASLHLAGVLYYLIFASGKRQSWAQDVQHRVLINNEGDVIEDLDRRLLRDVTESQSLLGGGVGGDLETLLTKSMCVERMADDSDETPAWYMLTI